MKNNYVYLHYYKFKNETTKRLYNSSYSICTTQNHLMKIRHSWQFHLHYVKISYRLINIILGLNQIAFCRNINDLLIHHCTKETSTYLLYFGVSSIFPPNFDISWFSIVIFILYGAMITIVIFIIYDPST